jgi:hypothetical protein
LAAKPITLASIRSERDSVRNAGGVSRHETQIYFHITELTMIVKRVVIFLQKPAKTDAGGPDR